LASGPAAAQANWQTNDFVPFKIMLSFPMPSTATGTIELHKDNPSGLQENDDQLNIPVVFKTAAKTTQQDCKLTGCSNEVCSDQDVITSCVYRAAYACYKGVSCARQKDGKCGWTTSPALTACLKAATKVN
jgi:eight-cysteine-cluster-containing protein